MVLDIERYYNELKELGTGAMDRAWIEATEEIAPSSHPRDIRRAAKEVFQTAHGHLKRASNGHHVDAGKLQAVVQGIRPDENASQTPENKKQSALARVVKETGEFLLKAQSVLPEGKKVYSWALVLPTRKRLAENQLISKAKEISPIMELPVRRSQPAA